MSFCRAEATIEHINTSFCIFLSKNNVYTLPLLRDTCQTCNALSNPHVITLFPSFVIIAPVTEAVFAGRL